MSTSTTQLAVIGGGPGGYAAAFLGADLGLEVTLIDQEKNPGGVCLYRGCIPSKALLHVAKLLAEARHASAWGIEFGEPVIDLDRLRGFKQGVVDRLTGGLGQLTRQRKIRFLQGRASIVNATTLDVALKEGGTEQVRFAHAVIATGSRPAAVPGLSLDSPRVLDSTSALDLPDVPKRLLVVGGGYIGLELGTVYAALGAEVSVVEMMPGLLPGADRDLVNVLAKRVERMCRAVMLDTKVVAMREEADGLHVTFEGKSAPDGPQVFDKVLVSVGRQPNSEVPGLDRTRVKVNGRGFIEVDAQRRTAEPTIFAIGDVAGDPMLAHKATAEGRLAAEVIAGKKRAYEPQAIPAVVFTDPELAWCGVTETEAKAQGLDVEVSRFPWAASGRAMTLDRTDGLTKLVVERESGRVLGMGVVGAGAGELIAEGVLAVEMGALVSDLGLSIHPHPTLSETIMEAADAFFGHATHIHRPRRA
ncbi:MAG: dihydrolipoyl dehydrogenase [Acidobacteria bacterium]|nr:dihydrolipoyl dehydrogenase [Acidobacteriota bacterium]